MVFPSEFCQGKNAVFSINMLLYVVSDLINYQHNNLTVFLTYTDYKLFNTNKIRFEIKWNGFKKQINFINQVQIQFKFHEL